MLVPSDEQLQIIDIIVTLIGKVIKTKILDLIKKICDKLEIKSADVILDPV